MTAEPVMRKARLARLRDVLPGGHALPAEQWEARHRGIVLLLWVHAAGIPIFALTRGLSPLHALLESLIVPVAAATATATRWPRRVRTMAASLGLLSSSAILVHMSGGVIEMHFHFFVMVTVVALYQDWLPFLAAVGYVFIHHGFMGAIDPDSVFNHQAALDHPWRWAGIHALFITGISATCLVTWRMNEVALADRRRAEQRTLDEARIVETLHEVGSALASELELERVVQLVTDAATENIGASLGAFFYTVVDGDGGSFVLFSLSGAPRDAFEDFGIPRNTEVFGPTFAGTEVVRLDDVTADARYGKMAPHFGMPPGHPPVRSYLAVPVRRRDGGVLGGLFFGHPARGRFDENAERIVVGIAAQASIAFDNARLYESERQARLHSDAARRRLDLLVEASRVLSSSLEVDTILREFAELVAAQMADYCVIDLDCSEEQVRVAAAADPSRAALVTTLESQLPRRGMRSPAPQIIDGPAGLSMEGWALEDQLASTIVVPVPGRDGPTGTLLLGRVSSSAAFGPDDLAVGEELARRAGSAVENAALYARQRTVALTLQHSLLPERLPTIPGIETAARYSAGGPGVDVGGDWYDVLQVAGGRLFVAMGDVVGRGEGAAALMGQLRNASRAIAFEDCEPAQVVHKLNQLLHALGPGDMATMLCAVIDPSTGHLVMANAGHPPPVLVSRTGEVQLLEGPHGPPIGAVSRSIYPETGHVLEPGAALVLYTDGLVEDRRSTLDAGMDRLCVALSGPPEDVEALCDRAIGARPRGETDDIAVLAVRVVPMSEHLHLRLPTEPSTLQPLRTTMRRWLQHAGAIDSETDEIVLAVGEACANAIRHTRWAGGRFYEVDARADDDVHVAISDGGAWRPPRDDGGGRGLHIIEAFMDEMSIERSPTGTTVHMRRRLSAHVLEGSR